MLNTVDLLFVNVERTRESIYQKMNNGGQLWRKT